MNSREWEEVCIADVISSSNTGLDAIQRAPIVSIDTGIKCLRIQDISQDKSFNDWGFCEVEEKNYNRFQLKKGDIIIARTGATIGVNRLIKKDIKSVYNNGLIRIKVNNEKADYRYVYYNMQSDRYRGHIDAISGGTSTQPNMKMNALLDFKIQLLPLPEQKVIADTLSALDDKIELNNRINKTLEEMAQAIFKSWFVDFEPFQDGEFEDSELGNIPKGWRVGTLDEIANITMGQSPSGSSYNEEGNGEVFYQGRTDFGVRFPKRRLYTTEPKRMASKSDILISVRAPVGDINVATEDCCIGRGLATIRSRTECNSYLLYAMYGLKEQFNIYNGEGTVFGSINKDSLNNTKFVIPEETCILEFNNIVSKLDEQILNNFEQVQLLTRIRNSLLPKLMSGEIRIPIEEISINEK